MGVFSVGKFLLTTIFTYNLDRSIKFSGGEASGWHKKQGITNNSEEVRMRLNNLNCW